MHMQFMAAIAALAFTGAAAAQSHSVSNMANPPQSQADNKAATEATPGRTATAHRNTNKQEDRNAGQARNAKTAGQGEAKGRSMAESKVETSGSSATGERVGAGSSATATTGMGAGNGDHGAEGAMEIKPSDAYVNPSERRALDEAPKSGKK